MSQNVIVDRPPSSPGGAPGPTADATPPTTPGVAALADRLHMGFIKNNLRDYGLLLSLAAIMLFFELVTGGILLRPLNLTNLMLQNSYIVIMAMGMLLVIVCGHIDLSIGSVAGFVGAVAGVLMVQYDLGFASTTVLCLLLGAAIGAAQGYWIAYFKIPSFIVTLAGMLVFKGLALVILQGQSLGPFTSTFQQISSGFIPEALPRIDHYYPTSIILGVLVALMLVVISVRGRRRQQEHGVSSEPLAFFVLKNLVLFGIIAWFAVLISSYRGLPNVLITMAVLIAIYGFVTQRTTIGRQVYAVGGNVRAAKLSGIRTERLTFLTFVNMGVLAALGGLVFAARLNTASPKAGQGFELEVIAACFIGGASAYGGVGKVSGAVIGALIIGVLNNGMSILGIGIDYQQVLKGLVLLGAVCLDVYNQKR